MNQLIIFVGMLIVFPVLLTALLARLGQPALRRANPASTQSRKPSLRNPSNKS